MCWSDCAGAQVDLLLCCLHMAKTGFLMTWFMCYSLNPVLLEVDIVCSGITVAQNSCWWWQGGLTHISVASHFWDLGKQCWPRSRRRRTWRLIRVSYCLLTGISIENTITRKQIHQTPLKFEMDSSKLHICWFQPVAFVWLSFYCILIKIRCQGSR